MKQLLNILLPLNLATIFATAVFSVSCSRQPTAGYSSLLGIEHILEDEQDVDKADSLIQVIDPSELDGDEHYLYNLLASEIKYKSFIDETDDSIISTAALYFANTGDNTRYIRSKLIEGRIRFHKTDLQNSIISAMDGLEVAEAERDTLYMARLNDLIADIYHLAALRPHEITKRKLAADLYGHTDRYYNHIFALLELGIAYYNDRQYERSVELLDSILNHLPLDNSTYIRSKAYSGMLPSQLMLDRIDDAENSYFMMSQYDDTDSFGSFDYANMAFMEIKKGNFDKAQKMIEKSKQKISGRFDRFSYYDAQLRYYIATVKDTSFTNFMNRYINDHVDAETVLFSVPTLTSERNYHASRAESNKLQAERYRRILFSCVLGLLLLIAIAVILYIRQAYVNQKKIAEISFLSTNAKGTSPILFRNKKVLAWSEQQFREMKELVNNLYHENFTLVNTLSEKYYIKRDKSVTDRQVLKEIEKYFNQMSDEKKIREIQGKLDFYFNGIYTAVTTQVPKLTEKERTLITYLYCGLSYKAISLFMGITKGNYYTRRSRIKTKIIESGAKDMERFLEPFNMSEKA